MKKNITFCEKKATRFDWCNQNVNGFVAKMCAVELNSLNLLLVGKSCFSGHVKTLLHLTHLALLATFPKLGSCKYLQFPSHLPTEMRHMHEMKDLRVARQLVRPDAHTPKRYEHIWYLDRREARKK